VATIPGPVRALHFSCGIQQLDHSLKGWGHTVHHPVAQSDGWRYRRLSLGNSRRRILNLPARFPTFLDGRCAIPYHRHLLLPQDREDTRGRRLMAHNAGRSKTGIYCLDVYPSNLGIYSNFGTEDYLREGVRVFVTSLSSLLFIKEKRVSNR
jgi:hypothetical protein